MGIHHDLLSIIQSYDILTEAQINHVLELQKTNESQGQALIRSGYLNEKSLYKFVRNNLKLNPDYNVTHKGYNIAGFTKPRYSVSGDFYGIFDLGEGRIAVTLSDVAGKGLEAGILAIRLSHMLEKERDINMRSIVPGTIIRRLNRTSYEIFTSDKFATFVVLILDTYNDTVEYSCAGSPPVLLYRAKTRTVEEMDVSGIPIGIERDFQYKGRSMGLSRGDTILLYTDGAYEAEDIFHRFYGFDRIKSNFLKHAGMPPRKMIRRMLQNVRYHSFFRGLNDDTTFVAIKKIQ